VRFTHPVPFAKRVDGIGRSLDIGTSFPWILQRYLATQRYPENYTPSSREGGNDVVMPLILCVKNTGQVKSAGDIRA
jgi:hypothetical protein